MTVFGSAAAPAIAAVEGDLAPGLADLFDVSLRAAEALVAASRRTAGWVPGPTPSTRVLPVSGGPLAARDMTALVRITPGATWPHHYHREDETVLVLQGGFRNDDGTEQRAGEQATYPAGTAHSLEALGEVD